VLLYSTGYLHGEFHVPHWVALSCYVAIGLGTMTGGWKIIETMGTRITKLSQHQGFSASAGGSIMLFAASYFGIPVSTTHTITGCVIGAGTARRASAVRWGLAGNVAIAWVITIPAAATVAAMFYWLISGYFVRFLVASALICVAALAWKAWRARPVLARPA
jgi:PiT family inorganic phosphate transporter